MKHVVYLDNQLEKTRHSLEKWKRKLRDLQSGEVAEPTDTQEIDRMIMQLGPPRSKNYLQNSSQEIASIQRTIEDQLHDESTDTSE